MRVGGGRREGCLLYWSGKLSGWVDVGVGWNRNENEEATNNKRRGKKNAHMKGLAIEIAGGGEGGVGGGSTAFR